jgi:hypothetical protein
MHARPSRCDALVIRRCAYVNQRQRNGIKVQGSQLFDPNIGL